MNGESIVAVENPGNVQRLHFRPGRLALVSVLASLGMVVLSFWLPILVWFVALVWVGLGICAVLDFRSLQSDFDEVKVALRLPLTSGRNSPFDVTLQVTTNVRHRTRFESRVEIPCEAVSGNAETAPENAVTDDYENWIESRVASVGESRLDFDRSFAIPARGKYRFGPVWLRRSGRCGILEAHRSFDVQESIDVLPETFWASQQLLVDDASEKQLLDRIAKTRNQGTGTEFESLSEFRTGDDPQRIDWRASARNDHLIIRRFQVERHRDLMIVVDCGRLMASETQRGSKLDCAVDSALMLGRVALRAGDRCGIATYDDRVLSFVPPLSGGKALSTLVHGVYDLRTAYRESDFGSMFETLQVRHRKRSLVVVLSDLAHEETTKRFRASLMALAKRHVVLFAAIRTPLLSQLPHQNVETMLDASRQAVGFRLQQERERAVNSLRRSAVNVLDVEPDQLTVPLINQFIDLRVQNRL